MVDDLRDWLTPSGAAALIGASPSTLSRAIAAGMIHVERSGDGRAVLVHRSEVERWARERKRGRPRGDAKPV